MAGENYPVYEKQPGNEIGKKVNGKLKRSSEGGQGRISRK